MYKKTSLSFVCMFLLHRQKSARKEIATTSKPPLGTEGFSDHLTSFAEDLVKVTRYGELKVGFEPGTLEVCDDMVTD